MTTIDKVIEVASAEVGYLEKASMAQLYDKTANAGSANYTKYWQDIAPSYQGQPWCAGFVTWCMVQAFGKAKAAELLRHYPYVYCPTMATLFELHANPQRGDIVVFYKGGEYAHTGIVTSVSGDSFTTIEGNTSGGSSIIPNGGAVCKKSYYNSQLPGTRFCSPNYSTVESEDLTMTQYEEIKAELAAKTAEIAALKAQVQALSTPMIYNYIDDNMPNWAVPAVQWAIGQGVIKGTGDGLGLTDTDLKHLVMLYRLHGGGE